MFRVITHSLLGVRVAMDAVGEIFLNIFQPGKPYVREDMEFWLGERLLVCVDQRRVAKSFSSAISLFRAF